MAVEDVIKITWKVGVASYMRTGGVFRTTLEAASFHALQTKKQEFLKEHSLSAEVIDFHGTRVEKVYREELTLDERHTYVEKITNPYLFQK